LEEPLSRLAFLSPALLLSCSGGTNPLENGPQTSYCEAVCEWAVTCAAEERTISEDDETWACLTAARAADPACADAESGEIDVASSEVLAGCTDAVAANVAAGECTPFDPAYEQVPQIPPTECATEDPDGEILDEARDATAETNAELCDRFSTGVCDAAASCIETTLGSEAYDAVVQALGKDASQMCQETEAVSGHTEECASSDLYVAQDNTTDYNTARAAARDCLEAVVTATCDDILAGNLPETCAGAFSTTDDLTSFGSALLDVATQYQDAAG
jgi:hypothetical protein